ncbi:3-hydroxyacyl-CoA dehydrogenase NAD-binding domain-containing protein [Methylobacterium trifolii]|uniref:Fatty acid oxidation complex subunit alpha n=1 Tax=Methylobacterium trifolii TaxID=1003092 RepID=A0ABQ4U3K3_9HYPH|nr:3-hydroxyacyl-CoA dehydrogenase NAD-binding domain-containing protein [Methylobacterium trifolii]GJE61444.1 Fatty acid oxidation complex subunit alpha [Methylobacterium trifolii]
MSDQNTPTRMRVEGRVAVVTLTAPPVNALSSTLRESLRERIGQAGQDAGIGAIVLTGAGRLFCGGADITEFGKAPQGIGLGELLAIVETSNKPIVAAIHGQALGGGLELALACHHRVATPSAKLGLPEVKLGIVPGAGGTQRLPRIVGPEKALEMITSGQPVSAKAAHAMGLLDALTAEDALVSDVVAFAEDVLAAGRTSPRIRDRNDRLAEARENPNLFKDFRDANTKKFRGFEAPEGCIRCVEAACTLPFDEGLAFERETFLRLVAGAQSVAQRHVFFAEREAAKIPDMSGDTPTLPITRVGVVGAGTMGGGIAMNFLNAGIPVTIVEAKPEALERGLETIRRNYDNTARKGRISAADVETRMGLLSDGLDLAALAECDLIIEAVFEDLDLKRAVFSRLDAVAKPSAILATNTSYLDVDVIAGMTGRPEHVLGLHFFSPANVMRLLEVVRGEKTDTRVLATAMQLGRRIGKVAVVVGVCHGFVGNRMLAERQREANGLILEGALPQDVDRVIQEFGLPMGPFAMSDLAGLDIGWSAQTSKGESVRDILCERDRRGQKTGRGFYDYDETRKATPSAEVEAVIREVSQRQGLTRRAVSDQEILERCLYPMVNEGAKILEEGKALRASDIDTVWVNGYGWPVYRGGPMHWADTVGLGTILERMRAFRAEHGDAFNPSALLERLAAEDGGFSGYDRRAGQAA